MQLSIEEVKKLDSNSYQIIDIRSEEEVAHGAIKGALNIQAEEIESDERVSHDKKLVIVCSRGKTSVDVAEYLTEKGFDAASLKGGYISWLLDAMKEDRARHSGVPISHAKDSRCRSRRPGTSIGSSFLENE